MHKSWDHWLLRLPLALLIAFGVIVSLGEAGLGWWVFVGLGILIVVALNFSAIEYGKENDDSEERSEHQ